MKWSDGSCVKGVKVATPCSVLRLRSGGGSISRAMPTPRPRPPPPGASEGRTEVTCSLICSRSLHCEHAGRGKPSGREEDRGGEGRQQGGDVGFVENYYVKQEGGSGGGNRWARAAMEAMELEETSRMTSDLQEAEVLGAEVDPGAEEGAGAEGGLAGLHQGGLLAGFFMLMSFSLVICMPVLIFAFS